MTTRHATAIPAPAPQAPAQPAPAPAAPQQAAAAAAPAPPPPPPASPSTAEKARVRPRDPPAPEDATSSSPPPAPSPAHSPTPSLPSSPHVPSPVIPGSPSPIVSPDAHLSSPSATTPTSSTQSSSSLRHHSSRTRDQQPSGTPLDIISGNNSYKGNEANNRIMLTVTLVVVFVILAGMGLVVYCLFRRRTAKRQMHGFGGILMSKNTSGSLGSSTAAAAGGSSGIGGGSGGRKSIAGGNRRSSVKSLGGGGDPIVTALAEMQEQQRRISDVDGSRALHVMTEKQHQNVLMTRRSSTLSLGGLHHLNHYQHSQQQQQHPGSHVVSLALGPMRPHSSLGAAGHRGGIGVGGADRTGQMSRRQSMSGIIIGSGEYVAGPLESSPEFRTTAYDDLYYPSRQFLYPSSGGGSNSSGANSNEQLLPPHHQHYQSYSSGPPSSVNISRRSSLSPGPFPTQGQPEMSSNGHQNPSPIVRTKTTSTSSGQSNQQQMQYPQQYPPSSGYRSAPAPPSTAPLGPHPSQMHLRSAHTPAAVTSGSDASSESTSESATTSSTPGTSDSQKHLQAEVKGAGVGIGSRSSTGEGTGAPRSASPITDSRLEHPHPPSSTVLRPHSMSVPQHRGPSPYGYNNHRSHSDFLPGMGGERVRSPPLGHLMSSSTSNLLDQQHRASYEQQHRASYDQNRASNDQHRPSYDQHRFSSDGGASQFVIPPSITTRRRSMMPGSGGPSGPTSPTGYNPYQQQQMYGGQDYYSENPSSRQYPGVPSPKSPYGYGNPYQGQHQHQYNYQQLQAAARRSASHLGQGKTEFLQDGAGVGSTTATGSTLIPTTTGSTLIPTTSSSTSSSGIPTTAPTNPNPLKSPPGSNWPGRPNSHGPVVHIAPAPAPIPSTSLSRASAAAAAAGLSILTPFDSSASVGGGEKGVNLQQTEVLDSPTDSSA
ncbi:hypothetical protein BGZ95_009857, partial [Linnemannia exigua]